MFKNPIFRLRQRVLRRLLVIGTCLLCIACLGIPDSAEPVKNFELDRYLGTWYEIARLDHRFERGLSNVTAHYALRKDGGVSVTNSGFDTRDNEWSSADGKAYFIDDPGTGRLKVSFFGPFYGAYNVVDLDQEGYQYSMVVGPNTKYLWILARQPQLEQGTLDRLISKAADLGFATDTLIFPTHGETMKSTQTPPAEVGSDPRLKSLSLDAAPWRIVNDGVMGGISQSRVTETPDGLRFAGTLSLENNGGFASARRSIGQQVNGLASIVMRVRGDGRRYQLRLRQDNNWDGVAWRQEFDTSDQWQHVTFDVNDFIPVFRGRTVPGHEPIDTARVEQLGLMLADGQSGGFTLDVNDIRFQF